jgi:hypothetical protein
MLDFLRNILEKEPARIVGYGSSVAVFLALKAAEALGVTLTVDVQLAISTLAGFVIAEVIRRFVYSPATTQAIANQATHQQAGTAVDIGHPPDATPPLPEGEL